MVLSANFTLPQPDAGAFLPTRARLLLDTITLPPPRFESDSAMEKALLTRLQQDERPAESEESYDAGRERCC